MNKTKTVVKSEKILKLAIKGLQEIKGENIVAIDLRKFENAVCDYFIICTGTSNTHISALAGSVEKEIKNTLNEKPWHAEGFRNSEWILIDYVNVVVHIFIAESRSFYNLEGLWGDAKITKIKSD